MQLVKTARLTTYVDIQAFTLWPLQGKHSKKRVFLAVFFVSFGSETGLAWCRVFAGVRAGRSLRLPQYPSPVECSHSILEDVTPLV